LRKERENVKKTKVPKPVNLNDCVLLWQMGYRVEINDGRVTAVAKEKKKNGLKATIIPLSFYHQ
jgi:hypothetical protein